MDLGGNAAPQRPLNSAQHLAVRMVGSYLRGTPALIRLLRGVRGTRYYGHASATEDLPQ